jgi:integrase
LGKAPVFPSLAAKSGSGKSGLSMQFTRIMDKAGIKGRSMREATDEGRSQSSLSFHSLRHSFDAALANAGVGVERRQELIGAFQLGDEQDLHASRHRSEAEDDFAIAGIKKAGSSGTARS